ncbi:caspase-3-like [Plakobranchus ocellatus]|uniref:Caspase-3-like n=1 Tax=Plakobranchus ocellatus TaxID=259542 RepID=A0AAV4A7R5_9GAST|nr:caspase-3-like [Plakobranchus ocellatus]
MSTQGEDVEDLYFHHSQSKGLAVLIINMGENDQRRGADKDGDLLKEMFSHLGFQTLVFQNKSSNDLLRELKNVSMEQLSYIDCFAVAISTHGREAQTKEKVMEDVIVTADGKIKTKVILEMFADHKCPQLINKPRLFFIQACRGEQMDSGCPMILQKVAMPEQAERAEDQADVGTESHPPPKVQNRNVQVSGAGVQEEGARALATASADDEDEDAPVRPPVCFKDFIVMNATPPGYFAFRNPSKGSLFLRCLKEGICKYAHSMSLFRTLTQVSGLVAKEESYTPSTPHLDRKKQVPVICSMLTKDIYFRPQ